MGVVECAKHELLQPFNVLYEKEGESQEESCTVEPLIVVPPSSGSSKDCDMGMFYQNTFFLSQVNLSPSLNSQFYSCPMAPCG